MKSFSWLKNIKNKNYPFWRFDAFFSNYKIRNLDIIEEGGWHFTNLKTPKQIFEKLSNYGHHNEFEISGITVEDIENQINKKVVSYNHKLDKVDPDKNRFEYKLKKINNDILPNYLVKNQKFLKEWFD